MSRILGKHDPLKKLRKYKLKFKTKPFLLRTNYLMISLIKKTSLRKLNFTLNINAT